jgi:NAD(P)-dependent dehydrogenase (short-subunit alcohol dehydrogenase family)
MGSIEDIEAPNDYAYRSSKAALNAAMKGLSIEVKNLGIGVLILHPGWVKTRMGGANAPVSPEASVTSMRRIVSQFDMRQSGHFYRFDGSEIPW